MQKLKTQPENAQNPPVAKQGGEATVASPQGERIAQLEAVMDNSPQAIKLSGLAAMMNISPAMAAQRKLLEVMHNGPRQQKVEGNAGSPEHLDSSLSSGEIPAQALIVNEDESPNQWQIKKDDFLLALEKEVKAVADTVLASIQQTSDSCPYIPYWFDYYQSRSASNLFRAIVKFAPSAASAKSWGELIQAVTGKVKASFSKHVASGSLDDLPEEIPHDLVSRQQSTPLKEVKQLQSNIAQFCCDCFNGGATGNVPMQTVNKLPAWGGAVTVGYHATAHWDEIQSSGEFRPGGGLLGRGVYVGTKMARVYEALGGGNSKFLEVGYVGEQSAWQRHQLRAVSEYSEDMEGQYDVLYIEGPMGQICYKSNGPNAINFANFRVRPYEE